jgi:hypothetical protein
MGRNAGAVAIHAALHLYYGRLNPILLNIAASAIIVYRAATSEQ